MKDTINGLLAVLVVCLVLAGIWGWGLNILALAHADAVNGLVILRAIGVFVAPLGTLLGFFA